MGLKVRYQIPYEISGTIFESDIDTDFLNIQVNTIGYQDSNRFLSALWNLYNLELTTSYSPDRVGWAYFPGRYSDDKGRMASFIGFADTRIGKLIIAISYKVKGNISLLHIKKEFSSFSEEEEKMLIDITSRAIARKDQEITFLCSCTIDIDPNLLFASYKSAHLQKAVFVQLGR